jgi:hypothetical protein
MHLLLSDHMELSGLGGHARTHGKFEKFSVDDPFHRPNATIILGRYPQAEGIDPQEAMASCQFAPDPNPLSTWMSCHSLF